MPKECALKIFKRTFIKHKPPQYGYSKFMLFSKWTSPTISHMPRPTINTLAEKEFNNLQKLHSLGINCPKPIKHLPNLRHIVIMQFIGNDLISAKKLTAATLNSKEQMTAYNEVSYLWFATF